MRYGRLSTREAVFTGLSGENRSWVILEGFIGVTVLTTGAWFISAAIFLIFLQTLEGTYGGNAVFADAATAEAVTEVEARRVASPRAGICGVPY